MKADTQIDLDARDALTGFLRDEVHGPKHGPDEVIGEKPTQRYLVGVLYPKGLDTEAAFADGDVVDEDRGSLGEELPDDPTTLANQWMPSSAGVSFFLSGGREVVCSVSGSVYASAKSAAATISGDLDGTDSSAQDEDGTGVPAGRPSRKRRGWQRISLASGAEPELHQIAAPADGKKTTSEPALGGRASLELLWRPMGDGYLITATIVNAAEQSREEQPDPELCLFQVGLRCAAAGGAIAEYPSAHRTSRDAEEEELRLLHRRAHVYAVGHGCAAAWQADDSATTADFIRVDFLPIHNIAGIVQKEMAGAVALDAATLADEGSDWAGIDRSMRAIVGEYQTWLGSLPAQHTDIPPELEPARDRLLGRVTEACDRMRQGMDLLAEDAVVREAFRLANRAIFMQRRHSEADMGGERRKRDGVSFRQPDYAKETKFTWYPFQLAFMLLVLPSLVDEDSGYREMVDLLWFPTGGGKTEAYLGLAAFTIFYRRLVNGERGAGTAVFTRYTLRLLTSQQFQRTATVVCACEAIRRTNQDRLGDSRITLGLWVGETATPNSYEKAARALDDLRDQVEPENPFQLERCPWCGTEIVPKNLEEDSAAYGVEATSTSFRLFCPSSDCPFHGGLPVSVIDEDLYHHPPSMLIGTVDKFARLTWVAESGVFFGDSRHDPPSLVIQDELHLLAGPLGTVAGIYETAIQALMAMRGVPAKIVASTATIRRAPDQSLGIFGQTVKVFPPSGLEADDSFFAKADRERPGRRYVGLMAPSHTMKSTIRNVAAALLQGPFELGFEEPERDAFWTLVLYHNSLRELGGALALARDDIPGRLKVIGPTSEMTRSLPDSEVVELTGNVPGKAIPGILARIEGAVPGAQPVSVVLATNMLSVGVDIRRLTLMLVNGQPKLTSEYIQATSRVGRGKIPGLVVACYSPTKPRDRSHFESFYAYHQSLYRSVEPSSVTPFSLPARQRALHAALVILVRHGLGLRGKDKAGDILRPNVDIEGVCKVILDRVALVDPEEVDATRVQLERLVDEWRRKASDEVRAGRPLYYDHNSPKTHARLLRTFGSPPPGWETLNSMRNVDRECNISVQGEDS